jgi:hypothetical protein
MSLQRRLARLCVTAALLNLAVAAGYYGAKLWDAFADGLA